LEVLNVDAVDAGSWRTVPEPRDEDLNVLVVALELRFDRAVGSVANPARHAEPLGVLTGALAEPHALDTSVDDDAPACEGHTVQYLGLVESLARARIGTTFNQYATGPRALLLRERLSAYLADRAKARILLVGEAAGYRGARISGIPFTSERQLTGDGPAEATATVVHRVMTELGLEDDVLLWNVVPTHPGGPSSNRPPTRVEIEAGRPFVDGLTPGRTVIAVGRVAAGALGGAYVRHPSHGGAVAFRQGLRALLHSAAGGPSIAVPAS